MIDIESLLEPIPGEKPGGSNLYYSPVFDKIREARRQEDSGPMGLWERERKTADFRVVIKLAEETLKTKTKDLWLAAWLTEAWIYRDGLEGLAAGLNLTTELLQRFWDHLFPEIEDDDLELRATPLEWLGSYFDPGKGSSPILALRATSLTEDGLNWLVFKESRSIGYEEDVRRNDARKKAREQAVSENKIVPEEFDKHVDSTPKAFYKKAEQDCAVAAESLRHFEELCSERFGSVAPSTSPLRNALDEFSNTVHILLLKKLEAEPDPLPPPEEPAALPDSDAVAAEPQIPALGPFVAPPADYDYKQLANGNISSAAEAAAHVVAAAQFLRTQFPASPVPYLVVRALRWGELRASQPTFDALLEAPSMEVRRAIRAYMLQKDWKRVLDTAESAMASPCGRGWLDLQRYAVQACEGLGYENAAKAIRAELKTLLSDFPQLPNSTLNDDTGAANPETLNWLRQEGFVN